MASQYKASIYNFLFNSINSVVTIVNGIIMVPLYFHYMSVSIYGAWLASGNMVAMIGLLESGFAGVVTQKMAKAIGEGDRKQFLTLAGSNILTAVLVSSIIFILGCCIIPFIASIVNADTEWASDITAAYTISLLSSAIAVLVSLFGAFPQVWQQTKQVGIINTCVNIFGIAIMVLFLVLGYGVISLAIGYLTRSIINLVFQGLWIYRYWKCHESERPIYDFKKSFLLLRECFYPFLAKVSAVLMGQSQSFILAAFISPVLAAVYDITSKILNCAYSFVSMANGSFFALLSIVFGKNEKLEINRVVSNIMQSFTICVMAVFVFGVCFSKTVIYYWVGLDKFGGDLLLITIAISALFNQYKAFFNNLLFSSGNIKRSSIIDVASLIVYLVILAFTIRQIEVYSLPVSMFITNAIFGGWYIHTLLVSTQIETKTLLSPLYKNGLMAIPFVLMYLVLDFPPNNIANQICYLLISIVLFLVCFLRINSDILYQLKIRLCK